MLLASSAGEREDNNGGGDDEDEDEDENEDEEEEAEEEEDSDEEEDIEEEDVLHIPHFTLPCMLSNVQARHRHVEEVACSAVLLRGVLHIKQANPFGGFQNVHAWQLHWFVASDAVATGTGSSFGTAFSGTGSSFGMTSASEALTSIPVSFLSCTPPISELHTSKLPRKSIARFARLSASLFK